MPNIITHKIFAEEVYKRIKKRDIKDLLQRHLQIYYIGSNGPDFLFFHHAKPWETYKDHRLSEIGSRLHSEEINTFYESSITSMRNERDSFTKESELAYIMGHLCHWSLDMKTHPYIFHRTGNGVGNSAGLHHRFESMLDAMMLQEYHQMDIEAYCSYEICEFDEEILKAIARIYVPAVKTCFQEDIKVYQLREALTSWEDIQKLLYDPKNKKLPLLKKIEKVIHKPWLISGNVVPAIVDERYDIRNEKKQVWTHPCDQRIKQDTSFLELFEEAIEQALKVIEKVYGCVEYDSDITSVLHLLDDRAYDSGMSGNVEMKYFNIIYEENEHEDI